MTLARALLILATRSLPGRRQGWAHAMEAEFDAAAADGQALAFSAGCLKAAWQELPREAEGRFLLASHALVLLLILPAAALMLSGALIGFRHLSGWAEAGGGATLLLNEGTVAAAPALTLLTVGLATTGLLTGWAMLDRAWDRAAALARFAAAGTATLAAFTATVALDVSALMMPVACLITQVLAVLALDRWHTLLPAEAPG